MVETVAKISQSVATKLLADPIWIYDIQIDANNNKVMNYQDAVAYLNTGEYIPIGWQPLQLGAPVPVRRRKR